MSTKQPDSEHEEFRPVLGYEGLYEVSNFGRVRSLGREVLGRWGKPRIIPTRILKGSTPNHGYIRVDLRKDGTTTHKLVHRLVAIAFIEGDARLHVNHKDCVCDNNHVSNLEWCTVKENAQHASRMGRLRIGEQTHATNLTNDDVRTIIGLFKTTSVRDIAKKYNTTEQAIYYIRQGKTWRHIPRTEILAKWEGSDE